MTRGRRIAIFFGATSTSTRGILLGVSAYARPSKPWTFRWTTHVTEVIPRIREWNPDGILAHVMNAEACHALLKLKKPIVDLANFVSHPSLPVVTWDEDEIGRRAAQHLMDRGFRHFGYLGFSTRVSSQERHEGFRRAVAEHGHECHANVELDTDEATGKRKSWKSLDGMLRRWVESLPKPVGVFTAQDGLAIELLEVCRQAGLRVPEDVAVVGVGDDDVACGASYPPLSSVKLHGKRVGYEAAALLDRMMRGKPIPHRIPRLPPGEVVPRQSSDVVAINEPLLAAAARFIRVHAHEGAIVKDLLASVPIERRELERGFRRVLGHTPLQEVHRARVMLVKQVLETTDLRMPEIAQQTGFTDSKRMAVVFKRVAGVSPSRYRRQFRLHTEPALAAK